MQPVEKALSNLLPRNALDGALLDLGHAFLDLYRPRGLNIRVRFSLRATR